MKTEKYIQCGNLAYAVNLKAASASFLHGIIQAYYPEVLDKIHLPSGVDVADINLHGYAPETDNPVGNIVLVVRDPVDRFVSAMVAARDSDADEVLTRLESGRNVNRHYLPTHRLLRGTCVLYRFDRDLNAAASLLGITLKEARPAADKPTLTPEQLARVEAIYAEDIALFNSITGPGTVWTAEPEQPEPEPVPTEVLSYKVFGQLAKEVMSGDNEQMKTSLTQAGTMTNLLMEMTKSAPEEQIPAAMKPVALNEIERTQTIQRAHPFIDLYGPAFGYVTEEEKDAFFIRAEAYVFGS